MQSVGHFIQGHECLQISTPEEFPELWILRDTAIQYPLDTEE